MKISILFVVFFFNTYLQLSARQTTETDSLKKALTLEKTDTGKIIILSELSFRCANNSPEAAQAYVAQETEIANRINIPKFNAAALNDQAIILYYKGDYSQALIYNKKALEIREHIGDRTWIISSLNKIAVIYQETANYEKAIEYQLAVLKIAEDLKNENYIGLTLNNISFLLQKAGKYNEARIYAGKALETAKRNKDTLHIASAYADLENMFEHNHQVDSAFLCQRIAIELFEKINALSELSHACNDMGYLYRQQKKTDSGLYYYKKALELAFALNNKNDQAFYAANIGEAYIDLKKKDSVYRYLRMAIALNTTDDPPEVLKTIYGGLTAYYILNNQPDSALFYNGLFKNILGTIYSVTSAKQINELQARYETAQKEQQINLLSEQNTVKELSINRKNIIIAIVAGMLLVVMVLGVLFYNRYRLKQDARLREEIMKQQHLASRAVIAAEDLERQRIAADLHDGIGQMFSAVKMNLSGIADRVRIQEVGDQLLFEKTLALVDESCKEVRIISHQMMPNVLLKSGLSAAIRDFIDKIDEHTLKITLETFGLQQPLDANIESVLYRVVQESVNNVIKHAQATRLDIQLHKDEQSITVTIEDNGKGFDLAKLNETEGIGLKSIKARVTFLNGKVDYDTAPGKGMVVAIYIPNKV
jgi:two-component system NarL family sensor kinase